MIHTVPDDRIFRGGMTKIPLIKADLPPFDEVAGSFREILENGRITNFGKYVTAFEEAAGQYLGTHVATVSSGTLGLILTLQALGLKPGQKVILPSFSFMATAQAVLYAGGIPVFSEIQEELTLCPQDLEKLLKTHRDVFAVLPVHLYGLPCRLEPIQTAIEQVSGRSDAAPKLIFDAAHAFGAARQGKKAGAAGNAEVFSLSVTKSLVCVEGGLVSSREEPLIARIRKMRNYGIDENYNARWPGVNGKMSEFHAIIGLHNLRRLEENLGVRQKKAAALTARIHAETVFRVTAAPPEARHTFKDFTIAVPSKLKPKRDAIMQALAKEGVETRAYFYPPIHEQDYFRKFADRPLPVTEDLSRRVITLPFFTAIQEEEMNRIVEALKKAERV